MSLVNRRLDAACVDAAAQVASRLDTAANAAPRALSDAWAQYQAQQLSAHAGESECRALEDAFLSGARAAFGALLAVIEHDDGSDAIAMLSNEVARGLGAHDPT